MGGAEKGAAMGRLLELMWNRFWNPQLHDVPWPGRVFVLLFDALE